MQQNQPKPPHQPSAKYAGSAFGCPREFLGNRFVYAVISARARGLSIGVNMNPDHQCSFDCEYCEVDRIAPIAEKKLDIDVMAKELQRTLALAYSGELKASFHYRHLPDELMQLRHVALSGDGEPTLCPQFLDVVREVAHVRALRQFPFFKIVLITNAAGLDLPNVQEGLKLFTQDDEIWAKLDAGTQGRMDLVNHPHNGFTLEKILSNIQHVARHRPVIIQSLFPMIHDEEPSDDEIQKYALQLRNLKNAGAQIKLVQIYSATRPTVRSECKHLPLKTLSLIARRVREVSGLPTEVY
jgi:wyosine [tRNA(Phe)-imidazoG37] synthetase (radical SAM superfamily)